MGFNPLTARVLDGVCKVTLTFESADGNLWCDHSNESSLPVLTRGAICFSNSENEIWTFGWNLPLAKVWQWKGLVDRFLLLVLFLFLGQIKREEWETVADPYFQIRGEGRSSRPWDNGYPFGLKIRGLRSFSPFASPPPPFFFLNLFLIPKRGLIC